MNKTLTIILLLFVLLSCNNNEGSQTDNDTIDKDSSQVDEAGFDEETPDPDIIQEVNWADCENSTDSSFQCSYIKSPLINNLADNEEINIRIMRLLSQNSSDAENQIWLIAGGPGSAGTVTFQGMMKSLSDSHFKDVDFYTLDLRGTGFSTPLNCPEQQKINSEKGGLITENEIESCVAYLKNNAGERLKGYTTTMAAIDLNLAIQAVRTAGKRVFLWGGSWGTILIQRYLQLFPNGVAGVVMTAINPPDLSMISFTKGFDFAGRRLLEMCGQQIKCSEKFSEEPEKVYKELIKDIEDKTRCEPFWSEYSAFDLKDTLARALTYSVTNYIVPAMIYRINRCEDDDIKVFKNFYTFIASLSKTYYEDTLRFSDPLKHQIIYSEHIWNDDFISADDVLSYYEENKDNFLFSDIYRKHWDIYNKWKEISTTPDSFDNKYAATQIPILMIQGGLDPNTPEYGAQKVGNHFNGDNQYFIVLPYSAHDVKENDYIGASEIPATCYYNLWRQFIDNPETDIDTDCVEKTIPVDFFRFDHETQYITGAKDLWEN